ncbi:DUF397 domain-containing protein [Nonomuraea typhae]|uniref:DUF397 domain-containing protein n=1 Tax=Nonomuraea typhae TaxID=2603600 RepID=A0ABW7Z7R2_9ACTN
MSSVNFVPQWFKSSFSATNGNCVEVAGLPGKKVAVRDTKNRAGAVLEFSFEDWETLLNTIKAGK